MAEEVMVDVRELVRRFGAHDAVAGISFTIRRGEIFGLLGPNGAGKTTTIRLLLGLLRPTSGSIRIAGRDPREDGVRRVVGWVPQASTLDPLLTGREQLRVIAALYEVPDADRRVDEALARFGLEDAADRLIRHYSGGMKKRLELAAGTLHDPQLLLLDEPTAALDVETRHQIWALIRAMNARGTTVLLTTHYLDEADLLCDRVAIVDRGRLLALDTPERLKREYGRSVVRLSWRDPAARDRAAEACTEVLGSAPLRRGPHLELVVPDVFETLGRLAATLRENGLPAPESVETLPPRLDEVFARVTGRAFDPVTGQALQAESAAAGTAAEAAPTGAQPRPGPAASRTDRAPAALPGGGPASALATFARHNAAFWRRWWWRARRDWVELAIAILQPALWLALFGNLWQGAARPGWAGGDYLRFMTPGAVMLTVFNVALMGGLEVLLDRERGALDRWLSSPAHPLALVTSRFAFVTAIGAAQTLAIIVAARAMGVSFAAGVWALPGLTALAALLGAGVTAASLALAFRVQNHGQFYTLTGFVSLPLMLVSSVFAPVETMPGWLAALARLNPMTYAVDGARTLVVGGEPGATSTLVAALLLFDAAMLALALRAARRAEA